MTTYKLLLDSPKYEKKLTEIKRIAKRYKKQIEITGDDISFDAVIFGRHKTVTGPGAIVRLI